jgi:hypothetical protein
MLGHRLLHGLAYVGLSFETMAIMHSLFERVKRNIEDPGGWGEIARDWVWKLAPAHTPEVEPTWKLAPGDLEGVRLVWPITYEWDQIAGWVRNLLAGFRRLVPVEWAEIPQLYPGIVLIRLIRGGQSHDMAIDCSDYLDQIAQECLKHAVCYFKMQYRKDGYGDDRIVPGGYVTHSLALYRYLHRLRRIKDRIEPTFDVYGRFGLSFATEIRKKAVALLNEQSDFHFTGSTKIVRHGQSLREVARARICIDLPGNGDFAFRLVDYLSVGTCIIGPPHRTVMHVPLVDRKHIIHCAPDLSDLVSLCRQYLENDAERKRVMHNTSEYFDRFLHRDQLARYYLRRVLDRT